VIIDQNTVLNRNKGLEALPILTDPSHGSSGSAHLLEQENRKQKQAGQDSACTPSIALLAEWLAGSLKILFEICTSF